MRTSLSTRARSAVRRGAFLVATALASTLAGSAAAQDRAMTVKLATATLNDAQHEWMKRFAALLEKSSGGRIKTELYPASQLGSTPRMIEATQLGSIQVWVGPPEFLVGVDQRFELLSVPGLFQNDQHALKTIADPEFSKAFLAVGAAKGLVGASLLFYGPVGYAMRTPVRTIADFRGKKIRVLASPFQTEQMAKLGAIGVPLTLGDVLPALQQGTIDGSFAAVPVFTTFQYQEVARYVTETGQAYLFSAAMLSKRWFDGLPAHLQEQVMAAAKRAGTEVTPWEIEFFAAQRKVWVDKGGEMIVLPAADKAEILAKLAPIGGDIVNTKPNLKPLWDQMNRKAEQLTVLPEHGYLGP
jgi:TRAP-type transport system periplasmic protein